MYPNASLYEDVYKRLFNSKRVLLVAHQNPDGDALGAVLAISHFLESRGSSHHIFCATAPSASFSFLPGIEKITSDPRITKRLEFDTFAILDSSDLEYSGIKPHLSALGYSPFIINIDHHPTNNLYGHVNLVEKNAASTTDIIFRIFDHHRVRMDKKIATCLLTGIITDTGGFSNLATTSQAMRNASQLLIHGARAKDIINNTLANQSLGMLKLWGRAFSRLVKNKITGIAVTIITQKDFRECGVNGENSEGIANFLNNLDDVKAVLVLKEQSDGIIKGSLRTTQDNVDVSKLAHLLGGGGHKKAAGFSIPGKIKETADGWRIV